MIRIIKIFRTVRPRVNFFKIIILPVIYALLTMESIELLFGLTGIKVEKTACMAVYTLLWLGLYLFMILGWRTKKNGIYAKSEQMFNNTDC